MPTNYKILLQTGDDLLQEDTGIILNDYSTPDGLFNEVIKVGNTIKNSPAKMFYETVKISLFNINKLLVSGFHLLQENGSALLQESGSYILITGFAIVKTLTETVKVISSSLNRLTKVLLEIIKVPYTILRRTGRSITERVVTGRTTRGANSPGTMADDNVIGNVAWIDVDNAKVSDNVYATVDLGTEPH
jgi:hypothetical protein